MAPVGCMRTLWRVARVGYMRSSHMRTLWRVAVSVLVYAV